MFRRRTPRHFWQNLREWIWPRAGWRRTARYVFQRLLRLDDDAQILAISVCCGVFISASPFVGMHLVLAALLAVLLRGNVIAAAIGTSIGNPFTFPFIWLATFHSGNFILGRTGQSEVPELSFLMFFEAPLAHLWPIILPMTIGGIWVGLFLALIVYFPSFWVIRFYKTKRMKR